MIWQAPTSGTIYYKSDRWLDVGDYVVHNLDTYRVVDAWDVESEWYVVERVV